MILTVLDVTYKVVSTIGTLILVVPVVHGWLQKRKRQIK